MNSWFKVQNKGETCAEISIHDEIGMWGVSAQDFAKELNAIPDTVTEINLSIHSPGGSVFDGLFIYNSLDRHAATVNVEILGLAASAASFIAMAGDHIEMPDSAQMMIHNAWSVVGGNAEEMEDAAKFLRHLDNTIVSIYQAKTGLAEDEIRGYMAEEKWMSGSEAKELGFVHSISDKAAAACSKEFAKHFKNAPKMNQPKIEFKQLKDFTDYLRNSCGQSKGEAEKVFHEVKKLVRSNSESEMTLNISKILTTLTKGSHNEYFRRDSKQTD